MNGLVLSQLESLAEVVALCRTKAQWKGIRAADPDDDSIWDWFLSLSSCERAFFLRVSDPASLDVISRISSLTPTRAIGGSEEPLYSLQRVALCGVTQPEPSWEIEGQNSLGKDPHTQEEMPRDGCVLLLRQGPTPWGDMYDVPLTHTEYKLYREFECALRLYFTPTEQAIILNPALCEDGARLLSVLRAVSGRPFLSTRCSRDLNRNKVMTFGSYLVYHMELSLRRQWAKIQDGDHAVTEAAAAGIPKNCAAGDGGFTIRPLKSDHWMETEVMELSFEDLPAGCWESFSSTQRNFISRQGASLWTSKDPTGHDKPVLGTLLSLSKITDSSCTSAWYDILSHLQGWSDQVMDTGVKAVKAESENVSNSRHSMETSEDDVREIMSTIFERVWGWITLRQNQEHYAGALPPPGDTCDISEPGKQRKHRRRRRRRRGPMQPGPLFGVQEEGVHITPHRSSRDMTGVDNGFGDSSFRLSSLAPGTNWPIPGEAVLGMGYGQEVPVKGSIGDIFGSKSIFFSGAMDHYEDVSFLDSGIHCYNRMRPPWDFISYDDEQAEGLKGAEEGQFTSVDKSAYSPERMDSRLEVTCQPPEEKVANDQVASFGATEVMVDTPRSSKGHDPRSPIASEDTDCKAEENSQVIENDPHCRPAPNDGPLSSADKEDLKRHEGLEQLIQDNQDIKRMCLSLHADVSLLTAAVSELKSQISHLSGALSSANRIIHFNTNPHSLDGIPAKQGPGIVSPPLVSTSLRVIPPEAPAPKGDKVPPGLGPLRSSLHWEICAFVNGIQARARDLYPSQMAARQLCTSAVRSLWPRAQVKMYGSYVTGLCIPSSDLDMVICLPKVHMAALAEAPGPLEGRNAIKETWQQNLARTLQVQPWVEGKSLKSIAKTPIPIITLTTKPLPLVSDDDKHRKQFPVKLDISFEGPGHNGLASNEMIQLLLKDFPPITYLVIVLKAYLALKGLGASYSGGLSSYGLVLLVARFLQDHYGTSSDGTGTRTTDLGMLLLGFLGFYGRQFDPRTTGISVGRKCYLDRHAISGQDSRSDISGTELDDVEVRSYTGSVRSVGDSTFEPYGPHLGSPGSKRRSFRLHDSWGVETQEVQDPHKFDPLYIEDPLRQSNNVGRNCFRIHQIKRAFSDMLTSLEEAYNPSMDTGKSQFSHGSLYTLLGVTVGKDDGRMDASLPHGQHAQTRASSTASNGNPTTIQALKLRKGDASNYKVFYQAARHPPKKPHAGDAKRASESIIPEDDPKNISTPGLLSPTATVASLVDSPILKSQKVSRPASRSLSFVDFVTVNKKSYHHQAGARDIVDNLRHTSIDRSPNSRPMWSSSGRRENLSRDLRMVGDVAIFYADKGVEADLRESKRTSRQDYARNVYI